MTTPNYLGIGAPKCATTWLAEALRRHPEVFLAPAKELVYFSSDKGFARGPDWYLSHFKNVSQPVKGEFSVSYMGARGKAAKRIHDLNPDMKLIAVLRDPVMRSWSHYRWFQQLGRPVPRSFLETMNGGSRIFLDSLYGENLAPFFDVFPRSNILLLKYEDILRSSTAVQRTTFAFLGVDDSFDSAIANRVIGQTISPRFQWLESLRAKTHLLARRRAPLVISLFKRLGGSSAYRALNGRSSNLTMDHEEYKIAAGYFASDVQRLSKLSGLSFDEWLVY